MFKKKQKDLFWGKGLQYDEEMSEMIMPFCDIIVDDHLDDYYKEKNTLVKQRESRYSMNSLVKSIETVLASTIHKLNGPNFGDLTDN